jgi:hypothetical protein
VELRYSKGEKEALIKWRDYEIETLIAIRGEMVEEFTKSARKQGIPFICVLYSLIFTLFNQNVKVQIQIGYF